MDKHIPLSGCPNQKACSTGEQVVDPDIELIRDRLNAVKNKVLMQCLVNFKIVGCLDFSCERERRCWKKYRNDEFGTCTC